MDDVYIQKEVIYFDILSQAKNRALSSFFNHTNTSNSENTEPNKNLPTLNMAKNLFEGMLFSSVVKMAEAKSFAVKPDGTETAYKLATFPDQYCSEKLSHVLDAIRNGICNSTIITDISNVNFEEIRRWYEDLGIPAAPDMDTSDSYITVQLLREVGKEPAKWFESCVANLFNAAGLYNDDKEYINTLLYTALGIVAAGAMVGSCYMVLKYMRKKENGDKDELQSIITSAEHENNNKTTYQMS